MQHRHCINFHIEANLTPEYIHDLFKYNINKYFDSYSEAVNVQFDNITIICKRKMLKYCSEKSTID